MNTKNLIRSLAAIPLLGGLAVTATANEVVHDAEYYVLAAQNGEKWAAEDKSLEQKLAELKKKHGTPPNIIHIMWDDTASQLLLQSQERLSTSPQTGLSMASTRRLC